MEDFLEEIVNWISKIPKQFAPNAIKVCKQLGTDVANVGRAKLQGRAEVDRARTKEEIKIIEAMGDQIAQTSLPPDYVRNVQAHFVGKLLRERSNVNKTLKVAMEDLQESESDNSAVQPTDIGQQEPISEDFLNRFEEVVRFKSSEEMQDYFGRILAGEIRKPGTFSIRTLTILSEIDQNVAGLFKKLCSLSLAIKANNRQIHDARVCSLGGNAANNALSKYSLGFGQLNILLEYGLIVSDYNCYFPYILSNGSSLPFQYQGRTCVLQPSSEKMKGKEYKVSGVALSLAGRELYTIVVQESAERYTQELKKFFAEQGLQMRDVTR